ncbi:MAG TPA: sulfatase-like hydrolase/transferase [Gemmatimonadaceae bacterium]|nr:sulfatase-like hydrolase/transferase [Gemmatimonadaceae bacterium]
MRAATLVICANAIGLILFLQSRADRLLAAIVDPLHPDWSGMERAFAGFTLYALSLLAIAAIGVLYIVRTMLRRAQLKRAAASTETPSRTIPIIALAVAFTGVVILVFIEVLLFQDYGIHLYEFDVFGILADAALRRDLGIQPAEVARVVSAAVMLIAAEMVLCAAAWRLAAWRDGALARACGAALLMTIPGGLILFRNGEKRIDEDLSEFEGALPLGRQLLMRNTTRPFIAVRPRLGAGGYPVLQAGAPAPTVERKRNIVFFVADGLRADMFGRVLTPSLFSFSSRQDVVRSRMHISTGHVSEAGIFGLLYGLDGQAFHSFIEERVPAYPLEVLKRNGYHTFLIASSRLNPYPSDQLVRSFDQVVYPINDDDALAILERYLAARRADGKPYFVLDFVYTPHYPFTSAKPQFRRYPLVGPSARTNYMNDVLQADDYFRQTFDLVRDDYERRRTVVLATSDHGEEIRDHGVFGHASATFWNEKIVVPFALGLPGASIPQRSPALTSHADVWPTLFDYLGVTPHANPTTYSDGTSLLDTVAPRRTAYVSGRFFPYADRPSVLVDSTRKYWFRADGVGSHGELCIKVTRVTDLEDRPIPRETWPSNPREIPAFSHFDATFWRFVQADATPHRSCPT